MICLCSFHSFADYTKFLYPYVDGNTATIISEKVWSDASNAHFDLTPSSSDYPIYRYAHYVGNTTSASTNSLGYVQYIIEDDSDYYTTYIIVPKVNNSTSIQIQYFNSSGSMFYSHAINGTTLNTSGSYSDAIFGAVWNTNPYVYIDADGNNLSYQIISFATYSFDNIESSLIAIHVNGYTYRGTGSLILETMIPIFAIQGHYSGSSGGDTSGDTSGGDSGGSNVDLSEIEDELADMNQALSNTIGAISSQTIKEESWHNEIMGEEYSLDDSPIDNMEDYVSQMDDIEASRDLEFSEGMDLINSFDESGFVDDVNSALVGLDDNINDITVMSFASNLYHNLGLGDFVGIFVGFAVIFILFKFVIGGVV